MGFIALENRRIEGDKKTILTFADLNELEPYAWENLIIQGHSVNDVLERMKQAVDQKMRDEEAKAQQAAAEKEYQEAMAKLKRGPLPLCRGLIFLFKYFHLLKTYSIEIAGIFL
ncbi:hypothetical protein P7H59_11210 [Enterococcus viikkiensis]|uniref:Uncharacterized protein n=1 Tax=Enterococcus viikkiensis TaxID=930854 RepID=A0ABU3FSP8_9ENTE|nr:hypothetical protein [Enterococcus viikkiensis]MDT2829009.1 hypothetical protein [Enterococcus viikkiensis]